MREQHLSDEAIAACADDVLTGGARERARRHIAACAECAYAVAVQREAVWALRSAPAPALPSGLLDRLRGLPDVMPARPAPAPVDREDTAMFSSAAAAFVAQPAGGRSSRRGRPVVLGAASAALVGAITVAVLTASDPSSPPAPTSTTRTAPVSTSGDLPAGGADLVRAHLPGR